MYQQAHIDTHLHKHMYIHTIAAVLLGQEIFVAGGKAEKEVINTAEVYIPNLNQWEQLVARMEVPRVGLAMVSMGNRIYVIGKRIVFIRSW